MLATTRTVEVEKRGRMLRRARRFGRPATYSVGLELTADVAAEPCAPAAVAQLEIDWDPVRQRARPRLVGTGAQVLRVRRPGLVRQAPPAPRSSSEPPRGER